MNPSEREFNRIKQQQKESLPGEAELEQEQEALGLGDSDTKLINERLTQGQPSARREDWEFYQNQLQDVQQRAAGSGQISDSDRRALEALQQVLHLNGKNSETEDVPADPSQYANTVLQTNKTTVEPSRVILELPDPWLDAAANPNPAAAGASSGAVGGGVNFTPQNAASSPNLPDLGHPENLSPAERAIFEAAKKKILQDVGINPDEIAGNAMGQASGARSVADTEFVVQEGIAQQQAETPQIPDSVEGIASASTVPVVVETRGEPIRESPRTDAEPQKAKVKVNTRPWWSILPLLAILLGGGLGIWYALRTLTPAPAPDPSAAQEFFQSGTLQAKQGQGAKAIVDLDQAIRLNPNDANLYLNRGVARYQVGNVSGAIDDYNQALRLNQNLAEAWSNRSQARVAEGKYEEAFGDASQAIQLNPNLLEAYLNRGNALFARNNLDNALQDYQRAQQSSDPAIQSKALNNIGNISAARGELDAAIKSYDQAIALVRSYADAFFNRAVALQRQNRTQEAIQGFRDAANLYQNQGNQTMSRRASGNADRLQQGSGQGQTPAASPQPAENQ